MDPLMEAEPDFAGLQQHLTEWLQRVGYSRFSDFGNRHGSWEITFAKNSDEIVRFLSLDLTPTLPRAIEQSMPYALEVWVSAESGDRFCRRMIGQLSVTERQVNDWQVQHSLQSLLRVAADTADGLRIDDLNGVHSRGLRRSG